MRITKFGHACVRIEQRSTALVLDPGNFTDREAVDGATAVLITHAHPDHLWAENLRATDAPIWTIQEVADAIAADAPDLSERVTVVRPGDEFDAGFAVRTVGELHAVIHPEMQRFHNSGYLVDVDGSKVFHPGDALTGPGEAIDLLLLPVSAPWLKISECVNFARDVAATRNLAIHDAIYSEAGLTVADRMLNTFLPGAGLQYTRVAPGSEVAAG
ncbi:MAG: MBL fold metallo-hydrolase [Nocardioides sp.]|uniref:MBL fold metallo-hydrolase n=1 Tax=Nocardioides sp. TaxID=35761 RepID=UPI003F00FB72